MSNISDFATKYDCTVWPFIGTDRYGNVTFGSPVYHSSIWYTATSETVKTDNDAEIIAKYKIITQGDQEGAFKRKNYVALGGNFTTEPNPINAGAHEIISARLVKVPFAGRDDELIVMV